MSNQFSRRAIPIKMVPGALSQIETMKIFAENGYPNMCSGQCPAECYTRMYNFKSSSNLYPSKPYAYSLLKDPNIISRFEKNTNVTYDTLRENILSV